MPSLKGKNRNKNSFQTGFKQKIEERISEPEFEDRSIQNIQPDRENHITEKQDSSHVDEVI